MIAKLLTYIHNIPKKHLVHTGSVCAVAFIAFVTTTHVAHANILDWSIQTMVEESLANFFYTLQTIASWLIYLAGALLNFSINLTMHIKEFVGSTEAIYTVWKALRDLAGMFIIFWLLYTAIMMIIGQSKPLGGLIKNIVIAGVLINFSFFLTGLAIDVSNIVSLQLYNAIAPQQTLNGDLSNANFLKSSINQSKADGGLSTIFMQSLGITRLYNPDGSKSSAGKAAEGKGFAGTSIQIIIIGLTSVIIMVTAALSFFLASLAFMVRFVILIALLAFSPLWFAAHVVPEIDKYASKWRDTLKSQLIFMPVYLLLMYFALSVLTSSSIFKNGYAQNLSSSGDFLSDLMVLAVNAVLVITMLNLPLLGAMSVGAIVPKWADKVGADAIWKKVGSFTGRNTLGVGANKLNDSAIMRRIYASEPNLGLAISKGLSKVSGSGFGEKKGSYDATLKQRKKDIEALHKRVGGPPGSDEKKGREYQAAMRENLQKRSVFNMMLKDRANIESVKPLAKKAEQADKKAAKKKAQDANNDLKKVNQEERKGIDRGETLISSLEEERRTAPITEREAYDKRINEVREDIKTRRAKIAKNDELMEANEEAIRAGREVEQEEKDERLASAMEKAGEKGDGGGGGDKKDDKKS